jgi:hypothetical protein
LGKVVDKFTEQVIVYNENVTFQNMIGVEKGSKVVVSSEWTDADRELLAEQIQFSITNLDAEEAKLRKNIFYEAPCFADIEYERAGLKVDLNFVKTGTAEFLELNRANFSDFIE